MILYSATLYCTYHCQWYREKKTDNQNRVPYACVVCVCGVCSCSCSASISITDHGPLAGYVKLWFTHAPGMPAMFSLPPRISDPDMRHGTCVTHVSWCMPGSLTCGFLWSWCRRKCSRHSWRMLNPQFYLSGKRPICRYAPTVHGEMTSHQLATWAPFNVKTIFWCKGISITNIQM